jgi:hypothetical protein
MRNSKFAMMFSVQPHTFGRKMYKQIKCKKLNSEINFCFVFLFKKMSNFGKQCVTKINIPELAVILQVLVKYKEKIHDCAITFMVSRRTILKAYNYHKKGSHFLRYVGFGRLGLKDLGYLHRLHTYGH